MQETPRLITIMVSFTDHYNAISIETLPSKSTIGKDSWYFNNSLLWKPKFSSTTKNLLFRLLKTQNNNHSSASDWWEYTKFCFKEDARTFFKNSTTEENIRISRLKKRLQRLYKKQYFNKKLNQGLKTYKINFIN